MRNGMRNGIHRSHGGGHSGHGSGSHPSVEILSQMGFETRDVAIPALVRWIGVFVIFIVVSTVGSKILYNFIVPSYANELDQPIRHQRRLPPFPQVQPDPKNDMMAYRTAEDRVLEGQAAMPGDKTGTSIDDAIETMATQKGIAGQTGDTMPELDPESKSFPGGGGDAKPEGATSSGAGTPTMGGAGRTRARLRAQPSPDAGVTPGVTP